MRVTRLLEKLIGIQGMKVVGVVIQDGSIHAEVKPAWRRPRCSCCGERRRTGVVATERRQWRHLDLCGAQLFLVYDVRRVYCPRHGTVVERVPWAWGPRARFTDEFDDLVAFAAQRRGGLRTPTFSGGPSPGGPGLRRSSPHLGRPSP